MLYIGNNYTFSTCLGVHNGVQKIIQTHMLSTFTVHAIGFNQYSSNKKGVWHDVKFMEIFYYSPKKAESLREVQSVLKLPELKIVKPSTTRWLSHEQCVIAKCIYAMYAFMYAIKSIYKCCINGCKPIAQAKYKLAVGHSCTFSAYRYDVSCLHGQNSNYRCQFDTTSAKNDTLVIQK